MQDDLRTQAITPDQQPPKRRMMDFAPVHKIRPSNLPTPISRESERYQLAQKEAARREAIRRQIAEQNRLSQLKAKRVATAGEEARVRLWQNRHTQTRPQAQLRTPLSIPAPKPTPATPHSVAPSPLRSAGDTKVAPASRLQIVASANRKLFGRIRPAGPSRSTVEHLPSPQKDLRSMTVSDLLKQNPDLRIATSKQSTSQASSFQQPMPQASSFKQFTPKSPFSKRPIPQASSLKQPTPQVSASRRIASAAQLIPSKQISPSRTNHAPSRPSQSVEFEEIFLTAFESSKSASKKPPEQKTPDTSENNMSYVLGGKSPFINTDKIVKRPLSDSRKEKPLAKTPLSTSVGSQSEFSVAPKTRKNVYAKREATKKPTKSTGTMIVEDRQKGIGISLAVAITLMIILGTVVGTLVYFAFFQ